MKISSENIVSEMIEVAANKAKITPEQSFDCVREALLFVQKKSVEIGPLDLSKIGRAHV